MTPFATTSLRLVFKRIFLPVFPQLYCPELATVDKYMYLVYNYTSNRNIHFMPSFKYTPTRPPKFGGVSILIIEDNSDHLYLIKRTLEGCMPGIEAIGVIDQASALKQLNSKKEYPQQSLPRLILLDLYLPTRAQGLLALQAIKDYFRKKDMPPVPVVVFSYSDHPEDIRLCYQQGANAYLVKLPDYHDWMAYFSELKEFWLETASLPPHPNY
jgi:CheY-like chemotaxis protein